MESPWTRRKKSGSGPEHLGHRARNLRLHPLVGEDGLSRGDRPGDDERELVVEEPDVARAPGLELDPALALEGEKALVNDGLVLEAEGSCDLQDATARSHAHERSPG